MQMVKKRVDLCQDKDLLSDYYLINEGIILMQNE
jgi:hypothetical protein